MMFQEGGPGSDETLSGMALNTPYYLSGGVCLGFTWHNMRSDGGILEIDFGAAHGLADGTPVYWLPPAAFTLTSVYFPTFPAATPTIVYQEGPFFVDAQTDPNVLRLCRHQDLSDPLPMPTDFSKVAAGGTGGSANDDLGDESRYHLVSLRHTLHTTRKLAETGGGPIAIAAQDPRLMTLVPELVACSRGTHHINLQSVQLEWGALRAAAEGAIRGPGAGIDNNGVEMWPESWAELDADFHEFSGKASLTGSVTDSADIITTRIVL